MDKSMKAARTLARSNLRALLKIVDDPPRHGFLHHEKLATFNGLSAAARFARMIDANEAGELLDKVADGMLCNDAMREPASAKPHLEALLREVDA